MGGIRGPVSLARRLAENSRAEGDCLIWIGELTNKGYGRIKLAPVLRRLYGVSYLTAHRAAWIVAHGSIPEGMNVLHRCDNRPCFKIEHLFLGTIQDNSDDMVAKGRHWMTVRPHEIRRGEAHGLAVLTDANVLVLREEYARGGVTVDALAKRLDVDRSTVWYAVSGKNWKHVGGPLARRHKGWRKVSPLIAEILKVNYDAGTEQKTLARWFHLSRATVGAAIRKAW